MRLVVASLLWFATTFAAGEVVAQSLHQEGAAAELAIARAGCIRCHAAPPALAERLEPTPSPALREAAAFH
jgi:hypothetical protein